MKKKKICSFVYLAIVKTSSGCQTPSGFRYLFTDKENFTRDLEKKSPGFQNFFKLTGSKRFSANLLPVTFESLLLWFLLFDCWCVHYLPSSWDVNNIFDRGKDKPPVGGVIIKPDLSIKRAKSNFYFQFEFYLHWP